MTSRRASDAPDDHHDRRQTICRRTPAKCQSAAEFDLSDLLFTTRLLFCIIYAAASLDWPETCFCRAIQCISAVYAVLQCSSVRMSHSCILPKRMNIFLFFFHRRVTTPFKFFHTKRYDNLPPGTPLYGGVKCSVVDKNRDSRPDSRFIACCQRCDRQVLSTRWHRTVASW